MSPVSYGAAKAIWDLSVERGLNLSREDIRLILEVAEPVILAEAAETGKIKIREGA